MNVSSVPGKQDDLHGNAPDTSLAALLLVDIVNDFDYPGGDKLLENARCIAGPIQRLKVKARAAHVPVVYVNDNFGRWQSSFQDTVDRCVRPGARGRDFVDQLKPCPDDYSVLKPMHSGFFQTPLDILLKHLGTKRVILTGLCTNSCILATAGDAYMRQLEVYVPADCVAAQTPEDQKYALHHMQEMNKAVTRKSEELDLERMSRSS